MLTRRQFWLLDALLFGIGLVVYLGLEWLLRRLPIAPQVRVTLDFVALVCVLGFFGNALGSYDSYRRSSGDPTAPPLPTPSPRRIRLPMRIVGGLLGILSLTAGLFVLLAPVLRADFGLFAIPSLLFGCAFMAVAVTGRDPIRALLRRGLDGEPTSGST